MRSERLRTGFMTSGTSSMDAPLKSLPHSFLRTSTVIPYRSLLSPTAARNSSALSPSTFRICLHLIISHHGSLLSMLMRLFVAKVSDAALFIISSTSPRYTGLVHSTSGHSVPLDSTSVAAGPNLRPRLTVAGQSNSCALQMTTRPPMRVQLARVKFQVSYFSAQRAGQRFSPTARAGLRSNPFAK